MNSEEQILNAIAEACRDDRLRFQIIIHDSTLHIYINRPTKENLDYQQLKQQIYSAIANLSSAKFSKIWLYCRILGEIEPDWQSVLEIEASNLAADEMVSMVRAISTAVDATNSIIDRIEQELKIPESFTEDPQIDFEDLPTTGSDEQELWDLSESELSELLEDSVQELDQQSEIISDFSTYCFIRNRRLLYAVLDPPWSQIARLIDTFDRFDESIRRSQLPILEAYFGESINPDIDDFAPETQAWWTKIKELDSDNRHKLAIWLSRYCLDAEQTISIIHEVLNPHATVVEAQSFSIPEIKSNFPAPFHSTFQPKPDRIPESANNSKSKSVWFTTLIVFIGNLLKIFKPTK